MSLIARCPLRPLNFRSCVLGSPHAPGRSHRVALDQRIGLDRQVESTNAPQAKGGSGGTWARAGRNPANLGN